jgi:hypothetical protein
MNPLRYLLRSIVYAALRGPIRMRYLGVLAGRAIGGWLVSSLMPRRP